MAQGLTGPIEVAGERWDLAMPGHLTHPLMDEESLADVLSYIRSVWGNEASTVSPEELKDVLSRHPGRVEPWTVEELESEGLR